MPSSLAWKCSWPSGRRRTRCPAWLYRKDRFHTPDGMYRIVKTKPTQWTVSKLQEGDGFAIIAEAKSRHLCWVLVQRLIVLDGRPAT